MPSSGMEGLEISSLEMSSKVHFCMALLRHCREMVNGQDWKNWNKELTFLVTVH